MFGCSRAVVILISRRNRSALPADASSGGRSLTATRRESWSLGSYNSVYLDRAALTMARVYLEDLKDPRRALEATREFLDEYPHSLLRSRARFQLVEALLSLGRLDEASKEATELERLHPKSRHAREARRLVGRTPRP